MTYLNHSNKPSVFQIQTDSIENRQVFNDQEDQQRLVLMMEYYSSNYPGKPSFALRKRYKQKMTGKKLVTVMKTDMTSTSLRMTLCEEEEGGISKFMSNILNSYSKYYNAKHNRKGKLWQGSFKRMPIRASEGSPKNNTLMSTVLGILLMGAAVCGQAHAAELLIKVGNDHTHYRDGDVVIGFTDLRISTVHAEMITHPWKTPIKPDGYRQNDSLSRFWYQHTHEYIFERVSHNAVRRTNLRTGEKRLFTELPDEEGQYIHVDLYIKHRMAHPNPIMYGEKGQEVWYGGNRRINQDNLKVIWDEIERRTGLKEENHRFWPFTEREKKTFFILKVDHLDDETLQRIMKPIHGLPENLSDSMAYDELSGAFENLPMIAKRRFQVNYHELFPNLVWAIQDPNIAVDIRDAYTLKLESILEDKMKTLSITEFKPQIIEFPKWMLMTERKSNRK